MAEVAALKDELAKGEEEQKRGRQGAARCAVGHPQPAARRRAGRQGREGQQGGAQGRRRRRSSAGPTSRKQHFEIGEALGLMDFETAAKLSGARFVVLKGAAGAAGARAGAFMLDLHTAPEKDGSAATPRSCRRTGARRGDVRHGAAAEVRGGPVSWRRARSRDHESCIALHALKICCRNADQELR